MMFKRRFPRPFEKRLLSIFWPENGWKRFGKYILLRLSRLKGSPHSIAIGFACGVAISFTPLVGLHITLGAVTAFLFGGNILASVIGTLIGNPWTFPLIWVSTLKIGEWFSGVSGEIMPDGFLALFAASMQSLFTLDFAKFALDVWPILKLMLIGSIPYYVISFGVSYFVIKTLVLKVEKARYKRRLKKMQKRGLL